MLDVVAVPAFEDNYVWLIHDGTHAAVVDPGTAAPVLAELETRRLSLAAILLTHHHADHVGGVDELLHRFNTPVFGPRREAIAGVTDPVGEGDTVNLLAPLLNLQVLDVPGHTRGHIAYFSDEQQWLFCGDTLFAGGCGRLFEGTPEQMVSSLAKFEKLLDATQVFCAHEYTLANLRFAAEVEPANIVLKARIEQEKAKRSQGLPTVPSTIGMERATNPFLRFREPSIAERLIAGGYLSSREPIAVFAALRQWKNSYH